jgi:tRNA(fMet)-specific endonuclease VapC
VLQDFAGAQVLPFDTTAATTLDGLTALRVRLASMDLRIAAITLSQGLTLLTRNVRDFCNRFRNIPLGFRINYFP